MITCYDATSARIANQSDVDCILVGDSVAMTMHGFPDTTHATVEMIASHVAAVRRGLGNAKGFVIADLPFLEHRGSPDRLVAAVQMLFRAGANAIKVEGVRGSEHLFSQLISAGVPIMGHLGLTPQSIHAFGGFKVQARDQAAQDLLIEDALTAERLGVFATVLECVPSSIAEQVTSKLSIPTIGIGAGVKTDGQVLVWQDLLGLNTSFKPKFVRRFAELEPLGLSALNQFTQAVREKSFPTAEESYS